MNAGQLEVDHASMAYPLDILQTFKFTPNDLNASWENIRNEIAKSGGELTNWALETLRQGLDGHIQSVVYEPHYVCKDHSNLHSNFYSKKFVAKSAHAARLHFFNRPDLEKLDLMIFPANYQDAYLGYSVIRPVAPRCLGRTVIDPSKIGRGKSRGYYTLKTPFTIRLSGAAMTVEGYPYMPQDTDATLCGHAALWSICRYLSEQNHQYGEILPYDLIAMTRPDLGRVVPHRGMTHLDYSAILSQFGAHPVVIHAKEVATTKGISLSAFKDVCTYIESGVPLLTSFNQHAMAIIGHTLDLKRTPIVEDGWLIDHSCFFDSFVVNDDNRFPFALLTYNPWPDHQESPEGGPKRRYFIEDIASVVVPLPEKIFLTASLARNTAMQALRLRKEVVKRLGEAPFVVRLFFAASSDFKNIKRSSLLSAEGHSDEIAAFVMQLHLPHYIWVMEISRLDQYKQGKCCGEIVLDTTAGPLESALIYCRIGNELEYAGGVTKSEPSPEGFSQFVSNLK